MTVPLLMMMVTGMLWALTGQLMVWVNQRKLSAINYYGISTFATVLFSLLAFVRWREVPWQDPRLIRMVLLFLVAGVLNSAGQVLMIVNLRRGPKAPIWALSQSAMIIPFLVGLLVYGNDFTWLDGLGVAFLLLSLVFLGMPARRIGLRHNARWLVLAGVTVMSIGLCQVLLSIPSHWEGFHDSSNLRIPLVCAGSFLGMVAVRLRQREGFRPEGLSLCLGFVVVASSAYFLLFQAMDRLAALNMTGLAFPIGVGTCIATFSILAWLRDPARFSLREVTGVLCTITGIILISV